MIRRLLSYRPQAHLETTIPTVARTQQPLPTDNPQQDDAVPSPARTKPTPDMRSELIVFASLFACALSLSCAPCDEAECGPKPACKAGYIKDVCFCCDVCAKTEGQRCGGLWNLHGECAKGLACVVRKQSFMSPGRCEPAVCKNVSCGIHQRCTLISGKPTCECPRHCKNRDKPVCGLANGVDYANDCELRKFECKIGAKIGALQGPCKRCFHNGELFKFRETFLNKDTCEDCVCNHGAWNCTRNIRCARMKNQEEKATTTPRTTGQGCPMFKCRPCEHGYIIDERGCQTCECKELKSACDQPMYSGPCTASFRRFYYNRKYKKCVQFTYGGCRPNGNNFKTKKACEAKCLNHETV